MALPWEGQLKPFVPGLHKVRHESQQAGMVGAHGASGVQGVSRHLKAATESTV